MRAKDKVRWLKIVKDIVRAQKIVPFSHAVSHMRGCTNARHRGYVAMHCAQYNLDYFSVQRAALCMLPFK